MSGGTDGTRRNMSDPDKDLGTPGFCVYYPKADPDDQLLMMGILKLDFANSSNKFRKLHNLLFLL